MLWRRRCEAVILGRVEVEGLVEGEGGLPFEGLLALREGALEGHVARVDAVVGLEVELLGERLATTDILAGKGARGRGPLRDAGNGE